MLVPAAMKLANLFILSKDEKKVTRALGQLKAIHLEAAQSGAEVPLQENPEREKELEFNRQLLSRLDAVIGFLDCNDQHEAHLPHQPSAKIEEKVREIESQVTTLKEQLERCELDRQHLTGMIRDLRAFVGLGIPIERLNDFSFLHFAIGQVPHAALPELGQSLGEDVVLIPREGSGKFRELIAVTSKKNRFALETELEKAGFKAEQTTAEGEGLPDDVVAKATRQIAEVETRYQGIEDERRQLVIQYGSILMSYRRTVDNEIRIITARVNFGYTEAACLITGWVPARQVNELTEAVLRETNGTAAIEILEPAPGVEPPSKFQHNKFFQPFSMLVVGYGYPRYKEIEPTIFVALSFLLMFAFMFGDVGQGCILLLIGLGMVFKSPVQKTRDFGTILASCGAASMIMGLMYGSYFGLEHQQIQWLPKPLWHPLISSNPADMIQTLGASIAVGSVMITLGLVFNIVNRLRRRDYLYGIFDKFGLVGALVYWSVLALVVMAVLGSKNLPVTAVLYIAVVGVAIVFLREPVMMVVRHMKKKAGHHEGGEGHHPSPLEGLIESGVEVMEFFISYLANSLSFLRLAAYAIGHAALLIAAFEMSQVIRDMTGPAGAPLMILFYILGNVVVILLEGLVAGIQAIRLEYYEFFGKFFSGSGRAYQPFEAE